MTHPRRSFSTSPAALPPVGRPELQSPVCTEPAPPSSSATLPRSPSLPPPSSSTSAFLFLYLCPPRTVLSPASLSPGRSAPPPSPPPCLLDQRPGDGTTRKAGFKIIMARAILITVARTTTISGWHYHYHYKSIVRGAATPPTTTAVRTPLLPVRLISHCTYRPLCEPTIDVRSGLCKDIATPKIYLRWRRDMQYLPLIIILN